ncbi:hypothetical protein MHYP_G00033930 [Metynnis hypsauchen]
MFLSRRVDVTEWESEERLRQFIQALVMTLVNGQMFLSRRVDVTEWESEERLRQFIQALVMTLVNGQVADSSTPSD